MPPQLARNRRGVEAGRCDILAIKDGYPRGESWTVLLAQKVGAGSGNLVSQLSKMVLLSVQSDRATVVGVGFLIVSCSNDPRPNKFTHRSTPVVGLSGFDATAVAAN